MDLIINDIDDWYDLNFKEYQRDVFLSELENDICLLQEIHDFYQENMFEEDESQNSFYISSRPRRVQYNFKKASKFHLLDKEIQNKIIDEIEAKQKYSSIAKKYNLPYQNILNWKKKGVLIRS